MLIVVLRCFLGRFRIQLCINLHIFARACVFVHIVLVSSGLVPFEADTMATAPMSTGCIFQACHVLMASFRSRWLLWKRRMSRWTRGQHHQRIILQGGELHEA